MLFTAPINLIFSSSLMLGTFMVMSSNNWLMIWMGLELNLLSFLPFIALSNINQETEAAIKYFLTQALASSLLLFSAISFSFNFNSSSFWAMLLIISLLIKMGMAPYHFWFPLVMNSLPWMTCLILSSWQKLAPLMILISLPLMFNSSYVLLAAILFSAFTGAMGGLNQTQLRPLMAYSSMNHLSWMLLGMFFSKSVMMVYFFIYIINLMIIMYVLFLTSTMTPTSLNNMMPYYSTYKFTLILSFFSLAGLPPLLGFFPKWIMIEAAMNYHLLFMTVLALIMSSLITLFYYLTISFTLFISAPAMINIGPQLNKFKLLTISTPILSLIFICPILIIYALIFFN